MKIALREVGGVLRATGASVTFIAVDAAVHAHQVVRSIDEIADLLKGGGGTDFRPAFDRLRESRNPPDVVVFATDGCGPAPKEEPAWCATIWLLVGQQVQSPCAWGEQIMVRD